MKVKVNGKRLTAVDRSDSWLKYIRLLKEVNKIGFPVDEIKVDSVRSPYLTYIIETTLKGSFL